MKILGLDLGSNSIGATIRDTDLVENQIERYAVTIFKTGVGKEKGVDYSFAAARTQKRSIRRLYQSRKYRLWATLEALIGEKMCPLTTDELNLWKKNIKGKIRQYPIIKKFEDWIKLDFDKDNSPDYTSPYQLRKEIVETQLNLTLEVDRFKLGRALYHIAQRRGFKSSKGETAKEQEKEIQSDNYEEMTDTTESEVVSLKKSEQKKAGKLYEYIELRKQEGVNLKTIGAAFADIEEKGERVREVWLQHTIRQQYEEEIKYIFEFQNNLSVEADNYKKIIKAIFYKRPLRSQKGLVGKCTLEKYIHKDKKTGKEIEVSKARCPISHPEFEEFRAWSFINNIRFQKQNSSEREDWQELDKDLKKKIFDRLFIRVKKDFLFDEIATFINNEKGELLRYNFKNKTNVSGNPVTARLKNLLGSEWKDWKRTSDKTRKGGKNKSHTVTYSWENVWHIWFSFEDEELVEEYARAIFQFDNSKIKQFVTGWASLPVGYGMLSVKAIRNINVFLRQGFIYTEAVLLAKIPEILGNEIWVSKSKDIIDAVRTIVNSNKLDKSVYNIANTLISKYKALDFKDKFGHKDTSYSLDNIDIQTIEKGIIETYGEKGFSRLSPHNQLQIKQRVKELYQGFFKSLKRDYYKLPRVSDSIIQFLKDNFTEIKEKEFDKLYHPSMIEFYTPVTNQEITDGYQYFQLPSPKIGSFKNPMAMRTLHELRKLVNHFLRKGYIDEETRIVIELARELNDTNKRWAIEAYQRQRQAENKEFENAIFELLKDNSFDGIANSENTEDIDKLRLLSEHSEITNEIKDKPPTKKKKTIKQKDKKIEDYLYKSSEFIKKLIAEKDLVKKYRLWKEQQFHCIYTGKPIKVADLFNNNVIDFEHTIPRSISFDNTLANLTVCYADFNRTIKRKRIPSQLDNHTEILKRIKVWEEKVEQIRENIEFWKKKSKGAAVKEFKDKAIRQRHLWQMELEYWQNKVDRFKMEEVSSGFKNRQLVDTQIISKYAFHYLKTVFQRVDVQKGIITAEFRKIFDLQEKGKEKDRSKHSHHAKDAAVLTLIPTAAKRDDILTKAWDFNEKTNKQFHEKPYPLFERKFIETIDEDILVNNITNDQALSEGKKYDRKRGWIVFLKDESGNDLLDNNQQKIKK